MNQETAKTPISFPIIRNPPPHHRYFFFKNSLRTHLLGIWGKKTHLFQIDRRLPELILLLVEIPHPDFPKVTRMISVEIRPVVMESTGHTASTGMLAVLSYSSVAGGDVAAAG